MGMALTIFKEMHLVKLVIVYNILTDVHVFYQHCSITLSPDCVKL